MKKRVLIAGGQGFIGRHLRAGLAKDFEVFVPGHAELELTDAAAVRKYLEANRIDCAVHAANVGGLRGCPDPTNALELNLRMFFSLANCADRLDKLVIFGSGAAYDKARDLRRVREEELGARVPADQYGFAKFVCGRYAERAAGKGNIYDLRLFGVFGPGEDYASRFISNAIARNLCGLDIRINQDVVFDYLYVKDLLPVVREFLVRPDWRHRAYNVTPDASVSLRELARLVNAAAEKPSKIVVLKPGKNFEYSGSNARLKRELPAAKFTPYAQAVAELYAHYREHARELDCALAQGATGASSAVRF